MQEQINQAKGISILDYLQTYEPQELKRIGRYYTLKSHDSMRIDSSTGKWFWNSQNVSGSNAIDYLMSMYQMTFIEGVKHLVEENTIVYHSSFSKPIEQKKFEVPLSHSDNNRVISYLMSRCIDREIIEQCILEKKLYESAKYHSCVFVGYDEHKEARFASIRATKGSYKSDVAGSKKAYGFALEASEESDMLYVFESPIDLLSRITLQNGFGRYRWREYHHLALGGVSTVALERYVQQYPSIDKIVLCLDNDTAGVDASNRIYKEWKERGYTLKIVMPREGKDYNENLIRSTYYI